MQNMENPQMKLDTELDTEMHYLDTELPFGKVGLLSLKKSTRLPEYSSALGVKLICPLTKNANKVQNYIVDSKSSSVKAKKPSTS